MDALQMARERVEMWAKECNDLEDELRMAEEEFENACEELQQMEGEWNVL